MCMTNDWWTEIGSEDGYPKSVNNMQQPHCIEFSPDNSMSVPPNTTQYIDDVNEWCSMSLFG